MDGEPRYRAVLLLFSRLSLTAKRRLAGWASDERRRGRTVWYVHTSALAVGGVVACAFDAAAPDEPARFYAGVDGALSGERLWIVTHLGCTPQEHRAYATARHARLLAWDRQWQTAGEG